MTPAIPSIFDREHIRSLQMALNEKMGTHLIADGDFGPKSIAVLTAFQNKNSLTITSRYDLATQVLLEPHIKAKYLGPTDYKDAACQLSVSVAAIRTIVHVEAAGDGFLDNGKCDILFERHKFDAYLCKSRAGDQMDALRIKYPNIISPTRGGYKGGQQEWDRFEAASAIAKSSAMLSTSWGMFQIMGFNHMTAGYTTVDAFVKAMCESEFNQLKGFVQFILNNPALHRALKASNWPEFARLYNGSAYKENQYDIKLTAAFKVFTSDRLLA